jgi:hypothetical protein
MCLFYDKKEDISEWHGFDFRAKMKEIEWAGKWIFVLWKIVNKPFYISHLHYYWLCIYRRSAIEWDANVSEIVVAGAKRERKREEKKEKKGNF